MKIAVDARELTGRPTGVGRYLGELLAEWAGSPEMPAHEWRLYAQATPRVPAEFRPSVRLLPGGAGTRWEQWTLARALAEHTPDVLFAPGYTAPLTAPCPVVLTVHDVSFSAHPEWFRFREGARRRLLTGWSARRARVVVTVSAFSQGEITRHLGVPPSRIRVIPHGIRQAVPRNRPIVAREPIVLFVGSIFRRRHIDCLVSTFAERIAPCVPGSRLEIIGENRTYPRMDPGRAASRASAEIQRRISIRSYVDEPTLQSVYARAAVFVFLSEYEGFGLTPLEALAAGVPPVVLDTPVAAEVYGPAARYLSAPLLAERLADAVIELLTSEAARHDLLRYAPEVLARYRWDRAAAATLAAVWEAADA